MSENVWLAITAAVTLGAALLVFWLLVQGLEPSMGPPIWGE